MLVALLVGHGFRNMWCSGLRLPCMLLVDLALGKSLPDFKVRKLAS